jgi:uncharacterized protein
MLASGMHSRVVRALAGGLVAAAVVGGVVRAQVFPKPTGYVSDYAKVLSTRSRAALTARLEAADRQLGVQIAVVTVPSLGGQTVETYATNLFNAWGIGRADTNRGVLVLVAPRDRQLRIEVGKGLERALTDDIAKGVVDGYFLPAFRDKRMQQGIEAGVERIIAILSAGPARAANVDIPVERATAPPTRSAAPPPTTPVDDVLGVLRVVPRPIQLLLLVIGLTVGAERMGKGLREHLVLAPFGLVIGAVACAAWWFPFSGWGIPGWLLLGSWTWLVFSTAWKPPRELGLGRPAETSDPSPANQAVEASAASTATPGEEPGLFSHYTRGDSFSHDGDEAFSRSRRRDRDWNDSGSSGSDGFGGGSSSGGGASGKW